ncbi:hypothetical protein J6590_085217 [Homalodisca vitripennis]|nr:hypothetical protein J6590_085217 [Homalodisca vitripennis]
MFTEIETVIARLPYVDHIVCVRHVTKDPVHLVSLVTVMHRNHSNPPHFAILQVKCNDHSCKLSAQTPLTFQNRSSGKRLSVQSPPLTSFSSSSSSSLLQVLRISGFRFTHESTRRHEHPFV